MDPWCSTSTSLNSCNAKDVSFEDNFKPTISETLPDSKQYLESLENKLQKLKNDPNVLQQLVERREACMRSLLQGDVNYEETNEILDTPVNTSAILRAIAPDRQALTSGEIVKLVHYEIVQTDEDLSDTASR